MSDNVLPLRRDRNAVSENTYGALSEANVTALEALLSEVKRTYAHVMWLENYVSELQPALLFEGAMFHPQQEQMWQANPGNRPRPGTIAWTLAIEQAKKLGVSQAKRPAQVHLAVQQLLKERQHLVAVSTQAIRVGIALDEVELAKQHGEMLVNAMTKFAVANGLDPTDKRVVMAILNALDEVGASTT
jgi:hypothetical protein